MSILLVSPQGKYATRRLAEEAKKLDIPLTALSAEELAQRNFAVDAGAYDALFVRFPYPYFDEIVRLARRFRAAGKKVVDAAIAEGDADHNKRDMYGMLAGAGLPIPKTGLIRPFPSLEGRVIIKWIYGLKGREVFLAKDQADVNRILKKFAAEELLAQEFIPAEFEYKVITVGYKSLPVVLRFPTDPKKFRPDLKKAEVLQPGVHPGLSQILRRLGDGGRAGIQKQWIPDQVRNDMPQVISLAEAAARACKRELAKVDILQHGSRLYILEVNRWPGFHAFEKLSGYNVAAEFVKYVDASV
jgi:glutathione synthase/RimK-type ligase-like ATP-grasp enzyme